MGESSTGSSGSGCGWGEACRDPGEHRVGVPDNTLGAFEQRSRCELSWVGRRSPASRIAKRLATARTTLALAASRDQIEAEKCCESPADLETPTPGIYSKSFQPPTTRRSHGHEPR